MATAPESANVARNLLFHPDLIAGVTATTAAVGNHLGLPTAYGFPDGDVDVGRRLLIVIAAVTAGIAATARVAAIVLVAPMVTVSDLDGDATGPELDAEAVVSVSGGRNGTHAQRDCSACERSQNCTFDTCHFVLFRLKVEV